MMFDHQYTDYKNRIEQYLSDCTAGLRPRSLYDPLRYVLDAGGKRIRPMLVLLSCEAVCGRMEEAIPGAAALEILHTFTLVHDDIMDNADTRRGKKTIHTKWDRNVAILVGDELLGLAYGELLKTRSGRIPEIVKLFTEGVIEVCEGQAYDKEFEKRKRVSIDEYMLMIEKKTGKMVSVATELGGIIGNGTQENILALRQFGYYVGRAFQIQDDLLDIVADEKEFGKNIGSDLQEGKKTFLLLEGLRLSKGKNKARLQRIINNGGVPRSQIAAYKKIYEECGAIDSAKSHIMKDIEAAKTELRKLPDNRGREMLFWLTEKLLHRTY